MQIILLFFFIAFYAAWFWFCLVYITQHHTYQWREMMMWIFIALLIRLPFFLGAENIESELIGSFTRFAGTVGVYVFLYFLLHIRYGVEGTGRKIKILIMHFVGTTTFYYLVIKNL